MTKPSILTSTVYQILARKGRKPNQIVRYFLPRTELNHESDLFRTNNQCIVQELGASGKSRVTHGFCDPGAVGSASSILGVGAVVLS